MNYEPVIGLEIHIQAKTRTKMFSAVSAEYFGKDPNTCVDPVSLGLPGAMPVPNKKAIELCIKLSLALGCSINQFTKFDRKNYFYPDLPKGYQISQYDLPIGYEGGVKIQTSKGEKLIRIRRVHMEEDTGKSIHEGNRTLIDLNKAGVPLIEVVTEPDFETGEEIDLFAKRLRQIVRYLKVSDADMEKGQMRYELNISVRPQGEADLPNYKVEVKNIGSISLLQKVMQFEMERQQKLLASGQTPTQETRGTRDMTGATHSQRVKEEADDYRYFPEPDIPPFRFSDEYIEELKSQLPTLPDELIAIYTAKGVSGELAEVIVADEEKAAFVEPFLKSDRLAQVFKLVTGELTVQVEQTGKSWSELITEPKSLLKLIELKESGKINSSTQKDLLGKLVAGELKTEQEIENYLAENNLGMSANTDKIEEIARRVVAADPTAKERFAKNPNMAMFFVGQIMKETKGSTDPQAAREIVVKILSE